MSQHLSWTMIIAGSFSSTCTVNNASAVESFFSSSLLPRSVVVVVVVLANKLLISVEQRGRGVFVLNTRLLLLLSNVEKNANIEVIFMFTFFRLKLRNMENKLSAYDWFRIQELLKKLPVDGRNANMKNQEMIIQTIVQLLCHSSKVSWKSPRLSSPSRNRSLYNNNEK